MANAPNTRNRISTARRAFRAARYYKFRASRHWRVLTRKERMLPAFIIAGASKCGTTALYRYLLAHPQVLAPYPPHFELGYFSEHYSHDLDWYRSWFPFKMTARWCSRHTGGRKIITGEHTPSYLAHPLAATRIAAMLPEVRIIILLRNPVERAYSDYQHQFRCHQESLSFREAIAMEGQRTANEIQRLESELDYRSVEYGRHAYLDKGEYRAKVDRFFKALPADDIMIIKSERLFSNTQTVFDEVCSFLSLGAYTLRNVKPVNAGTYASLDKADPELVCALKEHFRPYNESLYSYLGTNFGW